MGQGSPRIPQHYADAVRDAVKLIYGIAGNDDELVREAIAKLARIGIIVVLDSSLNSRAAS